MKQDLVEKEENSEKYSKTEKRGKNMDILIDNRV